MKLGRETKSSSLCGLAVHPVDITNDIVAGDMHLKTIICTCIIKSKIFTSNCTVHGHCMYQYNCFYFLKKICQVI